MTADDLDTVREWMRGANVRWEIDAAQNPPLRPDAAQPIRFASISTILRSGLRSAACRAAHRPV